MFETIASKIANVIRNTVRAAEVAVRRTPWLAPAVILALFLVW